MTLDTLGELQKLQDQIIDETATVAEARKHADFLSAELEAKKKKLLMIMSEAKMTSFKTSKGHIILARKFQVKVPRGDDLNTFFRYLQDSRPDDYEALRTVSYQTLNGWYSTELETAKEKGDLDFKIPGLGEPTASEYLQIRKV